LSKEHRKAFIIHWCWQKKCGFFCCCNFLA